VSQRRSGPRGLFSRAEDKVKLSDDEIEQAFTRCATFVERYFTRCTVRQTIPRARANEHYFHGRFYGQLKF
jgi:hypothetical protein